MAKTWKSVMREAHHNRGPRQRMMEEWLRKFYKMHKGDPQTPFTLDDMLKECGMDKSLATDRDCVTQYLMAQRHNLEILVDEFFDSPQYAKAVEDGKTDDEMFELMVVALVSRGYFPLKGEPTGYRLMTIDDFTRMKQRRMMSLVSEISGLVPAFHKLVTKFPEVGMRYTAPALPAPDGLLRMTCEECGATFKSQINLVNHYLRKHNNGDSEESK
jgi:hypothetical protein